MARIARLVAWLMAFMMIPVVHGFAETEQEAQGSQYDAAVKKLCALGFAEMDDNGQFYPENEMTRAEFTVMAVRVTGFEAIAQFVNKKAVFEDVRNDLWYAPYIAYAAERKIVSGDGGNRFYPDETITYTEAMKILVSAMGYRDLAESQGGYPQGYMGFANQQNLGRGVSIQDHQKITRGEAARICLNALDGQVLIDTTVSVNENKIEKVDLMEYLALREARAVVIQSGRASLQTTTDYDERKIIFSDGVVCDRNGLDTAEYLGYQVEYIYRETDDADLPALLYIEKTSKNQEVEIIAQDIIEVGSNYIVAETEDGRRKSYTIGNGAHILLNNRPIEDFSYTLLQPELGSIKLLANAGNDYNVIFIQSYINIFVGGTQTADSIIYDKYDMNKQANLSEEKIDVVKIENADGTAVAFKDIAVNDVVSIFASQGGAYVRAVRNAAKIEGTVTEIRDEGEFTIDSTEYEMTTELLQLIQNPDIELDMLKAGDKITAYLDCRGYVAAYKVGFSTEKSFAYMKSYKYVEEEEEAVLIKLFTAKGEHLRLYCADTVTIDGTKAKNADKVFGRLESLGINDGLIVYQTNADGRITYIDTPQKGERETGNTLFKTHTGYNYANGTYAGIGPKLTYKDKMMSFGMKVLVKGDTPIFQIPSSDIAAASEDYFAVKTAGDYTNDTQLDLDTYQLNPDSYYTDAMVVYSNAASSVSVSNESNPVVVKSVYETVVDDEPMICIEAVSDSSVITLYPNNDEVFTNIKGRGKKDTTGTVYTYKSFRPGDVFRYKKMPNGRVGAVEMLIGTVGERTGDGSQEKEAAYTEESNIFAQMRFACRNVYGKSDGIIKLTNKKPALVAKDEFYGLEMHKAGSYKIIYVDLKTKEIRKGTIDDIKGWKTNGGEYSTVLVQTRYGDARTMVVFNQDIQ